ncbi:MAG: chemotaxis protein CheR, partial [Burkholderiales bacterium]|nr:chemotaxis protein CheR [Burkholderiales bacterium]HOD79405.1 CheR family methyltransferase [Syntrophorhabdus sp.]
MVLLSHSDFNRLKDLIYEKCGILMNKGKKTMVEGRLQKRLKRLEMKAFSDYCDYLFSKEGMERELVKMINEITTNKTDFFRESAHFDYLVNYAVPEMMKKKEFTIRKPLAVWSAGCSTGEEPYTLAMVLKEFSQINAVRLPFTVLATDISTNVLEKARLAVYDKEQISPVPHVMKSKYLLKNKDPQNKVYRIIPELRETVSFRRLNFMDGEFGFRESMDIIFCRNVLIYFDKPTRDFCITPAPLIFVSSLLL